MKFKPQNIWIRSSLKSTSLFTCCCLVRFWRFENVKIWVQLLNWWSLLLPQDIGQVYSVHYPETETLNDIKLRNLFFYFKNIILICIYIYILHHFFCYRINNKGYCFTGYKLTAYITWWFCLTLVFKSFLFRHSNLILSTLSTRQYHISLTMNLHIKGKPDGFYLWSLYLEFFNKNLF